MKIDRLIGIITILQQKGKVTAPYLAEHFEVSKRTINRDIEDICRAGIPIVTTQGRDGGISIMEGYALDTTVFTEQELSAIFTGLRAVDSVMTSSSADKLAVKMQGKDTINLSDGMMIDLSSFYKDSLAAKIELIKQAIKEHRLINFHYYYPKGEEDKCIEPYQVVFKWSDWYVFGWCTHRQDYRMYKLRRLWDLQVADEKYAVRDIPTDRMKFGSHMTDNYIVTAIYDASVKYRLVEEYGLHSFKEQADGRLYAEWGFSNTEGALSWLLGFGDKVQVISPPEMVEKMKAMIEAMKKIY